MANKNNPAHDFAPAWLKIPTYDIYRPSGADSERGGHTSRRDEHSHGFARHTKENEPVTTHHQHFSDLRRERDDFDDSHLAKNAHNFSNDSSFIGSSANSQQLPSRRPHSRHDFRNIPASYSKVESASSRCVNNSGGGYFVTKTKAKLHDASANSNNSTTDSRGIGVTSNNFNQEFPSLQGDISEEPTTPPPALNGGVWEKPRNMKIHSGIIGKKIQLTKKPIRVDVSSENNRKSPSGPSQSGVAVSSSIVAAPGLPNSHSVVVSPIAKGGSSVYRPLLAPAKSALSKKSSKEGLKASSKKSSTTPPPSAHSMEILVKHPKAPGNKSEFLKALRNENKGVEEEEDGKEESNEKSSAAEKDESAVENELGQPHMNGIDITKLSISDTEEKSVLSSSLEAEERLLREMGWKEECSDDDNYAPITEDEVREFRDLTEKKYPLKNGLRRSLQVNFSPRRLAPFTNPVPPAADSWSSSSDSDSDY